MIKKTTMLLEFKRPELLYDLKNLGYIINEVAPKQNASDNHALADIAEEGNVDRVTRELDLAHANVMNFLNAYVVQELDEDVFGHDVLINSDSYFVLIAVNPQTKGSTVAVLRTYIHEYMVAFAMEDWTSIVSPDKEPIWAAKVADLEAKIKSCLTGLAKGARIIPHPFP